MRNGATSHDVFDRVEVQESSLQDLAEDLPATPDSDGSAEESAGTAADGETDDQPTTSDEMPSRRDYQRLIRIAIAALAALVFVAAAGLAGYFGWRLKQQDDAATAGRAALDVARAYAVTLTSLDNSKIDANFAQVLDGATGEFKDMYGQSAAQLRQLLIDNKAASHGTVVDAAIKSATTTEVDVLIFIDQSITNSATPEPRIDRSRVAITMEKIDNHWLASKVDIK